MDNIKYILIIMILALLVAGCIPFPTSKGAVYPTDNKNPKPIEKEEFKECDQAIDYKILLAALPKELSGFTASEPQGTTLTFQDSSSQKIVKYSVASVYFGRESDVRAYKDSNQIDISITDTCYLQFLSQSWFMFIEVEGTEGFTKKVTINGYPAWHQYNKWSDSYSYSVLIKDRVMVAVSGKRGILDSELETVIKSIDLASIAAAAK